MDLILQTLKIILGRNVDFFDQQWLPCIDSLDDAVDHDACLCDLALLKGLKGTLNGLNAIKLSRQRWVKVDDPGAWCRRRVLREKI